MHVFFTSDTHFQHSAIINFCQRPFWHPQQMDDALVRLWNSVVTKRDVVYHLGDVFFGGADQALLLLKRLNGKKFLVPGNHDDARAIPALEMVFEVLPPIVQIPFSWKGTRHRVTLCHYPMTYWPDSFHESLMLFGHTHGRHEGNRQSLDVGVDCWDYAPVRFDAVLARLQTLPPRSIVG